MVADIFRRLVDVLDACAIPYMLTGSFASSYYLEHWIEKPGLEAQWKAARTAAGMNA